MNEMKRLLGIGWGLVVSVGAVELPLVTEEMKRFVDEGFVSGVVSLVGDGEEVLHESAVGLAKREGEEAMTVDKMFWIASMTKPVTGVAVMMLVEEGKVALEDPVGRYLPEFKELKTAEGEFREVTILECLTHTAGLAELSLEERDELSLLSELTELTVRKPLQFEPGSEWRYSQTGINTAGRVVEVVSGMLFPEFLEKRVFGPLGMQDTTFYPSEEEMGRVVQPYQRTDEGELVAAGYWLLGKRPITDGTRMPMANGGLFSTARDYLKFGQMLLREGEFGGKRLLSAESVKRFRDIQTGELVVGFTPGNGWGLGCCVIREPQGVTGTLSPGTFGHGGAYGTQGWIDPVTGRVQVLMIQYANIGNGDASDLRRAFHEAVAVSLN